jgi:O-acetyl-ADP-ribose deacetylase (regulator of RNase III)
METSELKRVGGANIIVLEGDVTRQPVDAVVNSANENLQHGDGVAAAVVRTGGRVIQEESNTWVRQHGPVSPGGAAVTTGGMLQASRVIHAVAPRFVDDSSDATLAAAATAALDAAHSWGLHSIAFPLLGTGAHGFPPELAAQVIIAAVETWLEENPRVLTEVRLVGFTRKQTELLARCLAEC